MAKTTNLEAPWYLGTDLVLDITVKNLAETACVNVAAFTLSFLLKRRLSQTDGAASLTKTTSSGIAVSGTFDADPSLNTQVVSVTIADTDTDSLEAGLYHWELKRTDAGLEEVLADGTVTLKRGVHRS